VSSLEPPSRKRIRPSPGGARRAARPFPRASTRSCLALVDASPEESRSGTCRAAHEALARPGGIAEHGRGGPRAGGVGPRGAER